MQILVTPSFLANDRGESLPRLHKARVEVNWNDLSYSRLAIGSDTEGRVGEPLERLPLKGPAKAAQTFPQLDC